MTLRQKTLLIIGITLVGLVTLLYFISQTILLNSFAQLEEQEVRQNVERASAALQDELANLDSVAGDWAPWDDTYQFVTDRNEKFIEANLQDVTLLNLNVNYILFINTAHKLVFGKAVDLETETATDIPTSLQAYLAKHDLILNHVNPQDRLTGLISLPEGPLLFASHPIVTNNYEGPLRGTLIVGRYLDNAEIESLSQETHLSISFRRFDETQLPPDFQAAQASLASANAIMVRPLNQQNIAGYTLIEDAYGQAALVLKVELPRKIYQQGQASLSYFILSFLVSGVAFGLVILLLLERGVLARLTQLNLNVSAIATAGNSAGRVKVSGQDELATLGKNINKMLAALGESEEALRQAHQVLEVRVEERTAELLKSNMLLKHEIQERQQAEQALLASEVRFRSVVQSAKDAIILADSTGHILLWNTGAQTIFGYPETEVLGQPLTLLMPAQYVAAYQKALERLQTDGKTRIVGQPIELEGQHKDGHRFPIELSLAMWQTGTDIFYSGIIRDITRRKRVEAELAKAHQIAIEANRLKGQLLANVSHDLRTPLNAILGYIEMLQEGIYGQLAEKQRIVTQKIMNNTSHLTEMVNELLDQARLETGTLNLTTIPFSPHSLIDHIQTTMGGLAEAKGLQLIGTVAPDVPSPLIGDPLHLQQIVENLVGNAIKFTEQGSVNLYIYKPDNTHWAIQVADTGLGIPPEVHAKLFDPFWQVDSTATRHRTGFGLGLSIVKQLVTLMQGSISLTSQVGEGSTFTVCLPLTY